jgi:dihydrofolate reductase
MRSSRVLDCPDMRKIINSTYITLDGVVQDPHLWPSLGSAGTEISYAIQNDLLQACDAVIMGRRTYESFAAAWPTRSGDALSDRMNAMRKLVVSSTLRDPTWNNTSVISQDVVGEIAKLKKQPGQDIVQYGFGPVTYALLQHDLLDEVRFWVHPLILGRNGTAAPHFLDCPPARFDLMSSRSLPNGITILNYEAASATRQQ